MRKVDYCGIGFFGGEGANQPFDIQTGFFHGFFSEGNNSEGISTYALVEKRDGTVSCVESHKIRFTEPLLSSDSSE
jgi:hypothetical protein